MVKYLKQNREAKYLMSQRGLLSDRLQGAAGSLSATPLSLKSHLSYNLMSTVRMMLRRGE